MNGMNMAIYDLLKETPAEAKKEIKGGRLKGFTDINPMWRIRRLTEIFGPCGKGWKVEPVRQEVIPGANGEAAAFVDIRLYYKTEDGLWSDPIPGTGGSMFVSKETSGLRTNDEAFKMAYSDAIGIACKSLGMSEDVYFSKYRSKYNQPDEETQVTDQGNGSGKQGDFEQDFKLRRFREGEHLGETLESVWRNDFRYIREYTRNGTDQDMKEAIQKFAKWLRDGK